MATSLLDIKKREYEDFVRRVNASRLNGTSFNDLWWNPNERFRLTGFGTNINNTVPYFSGSMGSLDFTPVVDRLAPYLAQADNSTLRNISTPSLKLDNNFDASNFTLASNPSGFNLYKTGIGALGTGAGLLGANWLTSLGKSGAKGGAGASVGGFSSALGAAKLSAGAKAGVAAAGSVAGSLAKHFISDGYSNDVGNALADIGGAAGGIVSYFNPVVGALVSAGTGVLGGLYNRAFSIKTDEAKLAKAKSNIAYYKNLDFKNKLLDDIRPIASLSFLNPYKSGWFKSADDDNQALRNDFSTARDFAVRSLENAVKNIEADTLSKELATSAAYGGPINIGGPIDIVDPSTAIGYSIYTDKFIKDKLKKDSDMTNLFTGTLESKYDFGGGIHTKGADFNTGISYINAGGTHELNPNEGVQMGVDNQGVPNLVEEGEVRIGDYIVSNRLEVPDYKGQYKKKTKDIPYEAQVLWNYSGNTFADASKKIIKKNGEGMDAITLRGNDALLEVLALVQEKEREKQRLQEMQDAIDLMSPEEFAMLQQQMEAQLAAQQQLEMAMQQQLIIPEGMEQMQQPIELLPPIAALGGLLSSQDNISENTYDYGGTLADFDKELLSRGLTRKDYFGYLLASGDIDLTQYDFYTNKDLADINFSDKDFNKTLAEKYLNSLESQEIGPLKEVLDYHYKRTGEKLTAEDWNTLSDKVKERYKKQYKSSLNKDEKISFDERLTAFNKQLDINKKVKDFQIELKNSTLTKDDIKNFDQTTLNRLAKYVNNDYTPADLTGLSAEDRDKAHEKLLDDIVTWSKDNNKTLGDINTAFQSPELHRKWETVDYDKAPWTSNGYDYDEFATRTAAYEGSLTPGNLAGNYAPDPNFVFDEGIKDVNDLEAQPFYEKYTLAVLDAIERNKDVKWRYKEGTEPSYENLEFANDNKLSKEDYDLLRLLSRLVERTKTNPDGDYVQMFNPKDEDGYISFNNAIKDSDGKTYTASDYFNKLRTDKILGAMHLTPIESKSRDLYTVDDPNATEKLYHTLEQIGGPEGDWKNYYSISEPTLKEDGTRVFTLTPNKGVSITRADSLPEGIELSDDGSYKSTLDTKGGNPFPKPSNWPLYVAAGILGLGLANNIFSPVDYSNADALLNASSKAGNYKEISFDAIPKYLRPKSFDRLFYLNQTINPQFNAAIGALKNTSKGNSGTAAAGILGALYNYNNAVGAANRQAEEFQWGVDKDLAHYYTDVDKFNKEGRLKADMANQDAASRALGYTLEGRKAAYAMRLAAKDAKANAINAGLTGLANLAYSYGANKDLVELLKWLGKSGAHGAMNMSKYSAANGGHIRRKRGLGF